MNVSGSMPVQDGGISLRIVNFLQSYPSAVPIDFLAKELGRRPETLNDDLSSLAAKGVVKIDTQNGTVALIDTKGSVLSTFFHWVSGTL
jgi:hypothetical protein